MAALTTADCNQINTAIVRETGRIGPEIYDRVVKTSPWIGLTPRDVWPDGMGLEQTALTFERMLPDDDGEAWVDVAVSSGSTNNCLPPSEIIKWGQTLRTWNLQKIAKQTEDFCVEDLRSAFQLQKMLTLFTRGLGTVSRRVLENRNQNEYVRISSHKVTEKATNFDINATSFVASDPPTSRLTNGTLEYIYQWLIAEGAGEDAMGSSGGNSPVFGLFTDSNTSSDLLRQDSALRADVQYAFMGKGFASPLIQPLATEFSFRGYSHMINFNQPRYNIVGGVYVRVPRYKAAEATTKGYKREINAAYDYAQYADTIVHVPSVYTMRIPQPISSPGGAFKFTPVNYMGDFTWRNIPHAVCNPDGTIGFFRAIFASGSEPGHPEFGFVIRHANCPPLRALRYS
jgi:hypothetical protein